MTRDASAVSSLLSPRRITHHRNVGRRDADLSLLIWSGSTWPSEAFLRVADNTDRERALRHFGVQVVPAISVMLLYGTPLPE
jgi:hypothetical protein